MPRCKPHLWGFVGLSAARYDQQVHDWLGRRPSREPIGARRQLRNCRLARLAGATIGRRLMYDARYYIPVKIAAIKDGRQAAPGWRCSARLSMTKSVTTSHPFGDRHAHTAALPTPQGCAGTPLGWWCEAWWPAGGCSGGRPGKPLGGCRGHPAVRVVRPSGHQVLS